MSNPSSANLSPQHRRYLDTVAAEARNLMRADTSLDRSTAVDSAFGLVCVPASLQISDLDLDAEIAYVKRQVTIR